MLSLILRDSVILGWLLWYIGLFDLKDTDDPGGPLLDEDSNLQVPELKEGIISLFGALWLVFNIIMTVASHTHILDPVSGILEEDDMTSLYSS